MINKSKWIFNYNGLDPDDQLLVAEAIANELRDNEATFNENEYDKEKSRIVREFFNSIKNSATKSQEFKKIADIFERYESLSQDNKKKVINEISKIVAKYLGIEEQENKEKICKEEGHIFGNWKRRTWTTKEVYWDAGPQGYVDVEHEAWERTCSRCGFIEKIDYEPQELIDERKEKNKKARIKKLERELKKLKSE